MTLFNHFKRINHLRKRVGQGVLTSESLKKAGGKL